MIKLEPSGKFDRLEGRNYISALQKVFLTHFYSFGCIEVPPVSITSGIDSTVRFIGSHISVLKPYLTGKKMLPKRGVAILQDCVRTQNAKRLGESDFCPKWGSFFPSLGVLVPYKYFQEISAHVLGFLRDKLLCNKDNIVLRVNNADADLVQVCKTISAPNNIELDARPLTYYRHSLGMNNVKGRNFNLAFKDMKTGGLEDVGNVIVLEKNGTPHSVEVAIGSTTILKELYSLDHILDCHPLKLPTQPGEIGLIRQLEDTVITSIAITREGLLPSNKSNCSRLLKIYVAKLKEIAIKLQLNHSDLVSSMNNYEKANYGFETGASSRLDISADH